MSCKYPSNIVNKSSYPEDAFVNKRVNTINNNNIQLHKKINLLATVINYYEDIFNNGSYYYVQLPAIIIQLLQKYNSLNRYSINQIIDIIRKDLLNRDNSFTKYQDIDYNDITFLIIFTINKILGINNSDLYNEYTNYINNILDFYIYDKVTIKNFSKNIFDTIEEYDSFIINANKVDLNNIYMYVLKLFTAYNENKNLKTKFNIVSLYIKYLINDNLNTNDLFNNLPNEFPVNNFKNILNDYINLRRNYTIKDLQIYENYIEILYNYVLSQEIEVISMDEQIKKINEFKKYIIALEKSINYNINFNYIYNGIDFNYINYINQNYGKNINEIDFYIDISILMYIQKPFELIPSINNTDGTRGRLSEFLLSNVFENINNTLIVNNGIFDSKIYEKFTDIDNYKIIKKYGYINLNELQLYILQLKDLTENQNYINKLNQIYDCLDINSKYILVKINTEYFESNFDWISKYKPSTPEQIDNIILFLACIVKNLAFVYKPLRNISYYNDKFDDSTKISEKSGGDLYSILDNNFYLIDSKRYGNDRWTDGTKNTTLLQTYLYMNAYNKYLNMFDNDGIYNNLYLGVVNPLKNDSIFINYKNVNNKYNFKPFCFNEPVNYSNVFSCQKNLRLNQVAASGFSQRSVKRQFNDIGNSKRLRNGTN